MLTVGLFANTAPAHDITDRITAVGDDEISALNTPIGDVTITPKDRL